jgi:hypothetical protein
VKSERETAQSDVDERITTSNLSNRDIISAGFVMFLNKDYNKQRKEKTKERKRIIKTRNYHTRSITTCPGHSSIDIHN